CAARMAAWSIPKLWCICPNLKPLFGWTTHGCKRYLKLHVVDLWPCAESLQATHPHSCAHTRRARVWRPAFTPSPRLVTHRATRRLRCNQAQSDLPSLAMSRTTPHCLYATQTGKCNLTWM